MVVTPQPAVAFGIMAYNEEANIVPLLDSVLGDPQNDFLTRVVVVASGCTDRTVEFVDGYASRDARVELIVEDRREGKISAINTFLAAIREPIVVVSCGDLVFEPGSVRALVEPLFQAGIGLSGAHPIPQNDPGTFTGFAVNLMWDLHHRIAMLSPKMGEVIAFRNIFLLLDTNALCDELSIEKKIVDAGLEVRYAAGARVRNMGPRTLADFVRQRIRWNAANFQIIADHRMTVATMRPGSVLRAVSQYVREARPRLDWLVAAALLEAYCRIRAYTDYHFFRQRAKHRVWAPIASTKRVSIDP